MFCRKGSRENKSVYSADVSFMCISHQRLTLPPLLPFLGQLATTLHSDLIKSWVTVSEDELPVTKEVSADVIMHS